MTTARTPAGVPAGGRFAPTPHAETPANVRLGPAELDDDEEWVPPRRCDRCGEAVDESPVPGSFCDDQLGRSKYHPAKNW